MKHVHSEEFKYIFKECKQLTTIQSRLVELKLILKNKKNISEFDGIQIIRKHAIEFS